MLLACWGGFGKRLVGVAPLGVHPEADRARRATCVNKTSSKLHARCAHRARILSDIAVDTTRGIVDDDAHNVCPTHQYSKNHLALA